MKGLWRVMFPSDQVLSLLFVILGSAGGAGASDEVFELEQDLIGRETWSRIAHGEVGCVV